MRSVKTLPIGGGGAAVIPLSPEPSLDLQPNEKVIGTTTVNGRCSGGVFFGNSRRFSAATPPLTIDSTALNQAQQGSFIPCCRFPLVAGRIAGYVGFEPERARKRCGGSGGRRTLAGQV